MANKYVSPNRLSLFLENLKNIFSPLTHTHTVSELSDYAVDSELSPTSYNPVANNVINAEFDAVATAMSALDSAIDGKASLDHNHDDKYDAIGSSETALTSAKEYTDNKVASMVFIGTYAEYKTAYDNGEIPLNTFVILTDDNDSSGDGSDNTSTSTSSKLGEGVLGYMILG